MDTRELILDVAFRGFLENGFEKISLNELIRRTELTKGGFYYYFKSKDELLSEILFKYFHKYLDYDISGMIDLNGTVIENLTKAIKSFTDIGERIKNMSKENIDPKSFFMLFQEGLKRDEKLKKYNDEKQMKILTGLVLMVSKGQENGEIRDDISSKEIVYLLHACIKGSMFNSKIVGSEVWNSSVDENIEIFFKMIKKI